MAKLAKKLIEQRKFENYYRSFIFATKTRNSSTAESSVTFFLKWIIFFWRLVKHVKDNDLVSF